MPNKTKPFVRRGRKAAGLIEDGRAAEGLAFGVFGLFVLERSANRRDICISQSNSSKIVQPLLPGRNCMFDVLEPGMDSRRVI